MATVPAAPATRKALWEAVVRYEAKKVHLVMGLRNTIGIMLPVAVGALLGNATRGMTGGMGALNIAVADGTDAYAHRARRMLLTSFCCALGVITGGIAGGTNWMTAMLAGGAFIAGMMVAVGQAAGDTALVTLVMMIIYSASPLSSEQALTSGLLAFGGGLFQTALSLLNWPIQQNLPERRALAAFYLELARAAGSSAVVTVAPPATEESTAAQQVLASLDARDSLDAERYLALLSQAERMRLGLLTLARLRARIGREAHTETQTVALGECAMLTARALQYIGDSLPRSEGGGEPPEVSDELGRVGERLRQSCGAASSAALAALLEDARSQVDALAGQVRTALDITKQTGERGRAEFDKREAAQPWKLKFAGTRSLLAANLRLQSSTFRHALRLAVCVAGGEFLARELHLQRPYWVPMTIALVLKPDFTTTLSRGLQRLAGTFAGLLGSTALFHVITPTLAIQLPLMAVFAFLLRAYGSANYGIVAVAVTGLVVMLFGMSGVAPGDVIASRGLNTLIGGGIAMLAYFLWPTWERTLAPEALARMLDAYRTYFQAVRDSYLRGDNVIGAALDRARLEARLARSNLEASIGRLRAEPGTGAERVAKFDRILADSHRFIHAVMSLEAGLQLSRPVQAREAFQKLSNGVDVTLYYLAARLRGAPMAATDFPDLREIHHALVGSGNVGEQRYALVNTESDRIVNSLNTLTVEIREMVVGSLRH